MKEKIGGWVQVSQQEKYDNPWITVTHEEVRRPNGSEGIYGVVHFKNQAIGVLPLDEQGNTWLVKQSRYTLGEFTWEIPEGGSPVGEDPLDSAKRELREETGLQADSWELLINIHTSNSVTDEVGFIYLARGLTQGPQALEDSEDIVVEKMPLSRAVDMALSGEITDALSIAALYRAALMGLHLQK